MTTEAPNHVADISEAIMHVGERARRITRLHPQVAFTRPRASFRVETESGLSLKARRFESEPAAKRQQDLRACLPEAFAPVLDRVGAILLERWIDGRPVGAEVADERVIRQTAQIAAALHALPHAADVRVPFRASVTELLAATCSGLGALADACALEAQVAECLRTIVNETTPTESRHCLIHTDLCAENLVVNTAGQVVVIDNEHFRIGPPGMDLARTWYRWGWHDSRRGDREWPLFRRAYEDAGGDPEAVANETFWRVAAVAASARIRLSDGGAGVTAAAQVLSTLAREARRARRP
jgi:aminoglycoside phosphotransferase (APT) family kinase protein